MVSNLATHLIHVKQRNNTFISMSVHMHTILNIYTQFHSPSKNTCQSGLSLFPG